MLLSGGSNAWIVLLRQGFNALDISLNPAVINRLIVPIHLQLLSIALLDLVSQLGYLKPSIVAEIFFYVLKYPILKPFRYPIRPQRQPAPTSSPSAHQIAHRVCETEGAGDVLPSPRGR